MEDNLFSAARFGGIGWLNSMRLRLDAIEYEWNQLVVNYDEDVQFELFERLFGEVTEQKVIILMATLGFIVIVVVGFTVINIEPRIRRTPINRFYLSVCKELEKVNLVRRLGEGPIAFRDRVCSQRSELAGAMTELTELYVKLNYVEKSASSVTEKKSEMQAFRAAYAKLKSKIPTLARLRRIG